MAALVTVRAEPEVIVGVATLIKLKPVAVVTFIAPESVAVVAGTLTPFHTALIAEANF